MQRVREEMVPIALSDRPIFDQYFAQYPPVVSSLNFANLFCWQLPSDYRFREVEGHLVISFVDAGQTLFYPPVGPQPDHLMVEILPSSAGYAWTRVPEELARRIGDRLPLVFDRDNSDYLYRLEDLRALRGKRYDGKRNFIKRCAALGPRVVPLGSEVRPACLELHDHWLKRQKIPRDPLLQEEAAAVRRALEHFDGLSLHGIAVLISGEVRGFAIGIPLNANTFVEHFEKADEEITGIYPFLLSEFVQSIPAHFTFLNREQDLGIPGLRRAKESWQPFGLVRKYRLRESKP